MKKCCFCKIRQAKINIEQNMGNRKQAIHICYICAEEKGFSVNMTHEQTNNFCRKLIEDFKDFSKLTQKNQLSCFNCQTKKSDFQATKNVGCSYCYDVFKDFIDNEYSLLRHKPNEFNTIHPNNFFLLKKYKYEIEKHLKEENYEIAGVLHKKIKSLEND